MIVEKRRKKKKVEIDQSKRINHTVNRCVRDMYKVHKYNLYLLSCYFFVIFPSPPTNSRNNEDAFGLDGHLFTIILCISRRFFVV